MERNSTTSDLAGIRVRTGALQTRRSSATRARIRDVTRFLVSSGSPVNVKEIAGAAGLSRSTFYSHFAHLDELAVDILAQDLLAQPFSADMLVDVYVRNRDFYRQTLQETGSRAVLETAVQITAEALLDRVSEPSAEDRGRLERLAYFTAWGYIGTLDDWLRATTPSSADDLKAFLREQMPVIFQPGTS